MQRYYFHLHDRTGNVCDPEGRLFETVAAARGYAVYAARSIMSGDVLEGIFDPNGSVEVTDERGNRVFTLRFDEAVVRVM